VHRHVDGIGSCEFKIIHVDTQATDSLAQQMNELLHSLIISFFSRFVLFFFLFPCSSDMIASE